MRAWPIPNIKIGKSDKDLLEPLSDIIVYVIWTKKIMPFEQVTIWIKLNLYCYINIHMNALLSDIAYYQIAE